MEYNSFVGVFALLVIVLVILRQALAERGSSKTAFSDEFKTFQRSYLVVYLLMMAADWLQGPYVYALYVDYGYTETEIGQLFVVGFGTSMIFGSFIGSAADKYGRKKMCLAYGILYSVCCWTKHSPDYWVLMFGRFLGGISTSILYSAFESWMVHQHHTKAFPNEWLTATFGTATTINGFVAIAAGVLGNLLVDKTDSKVAPFDASSVFLLLGCAFILYSWQENYGDQEAPMMSNLRTASMRMMKDPRILLVGCIQSFFEAAMFVFVFKWTPALSNVGDNHGWVFAAFMSAVMIGSTLFGYLTRQGYVIERFAVFVFIASAVALFTPVATKDPDFRLAAFLCFEVCVGLFWPSLMTMRGCYVPEEVRATLMNFFRVPLNFIVVSVVYQQRPENVTFSICTALLIFATICQFILKNLTVDSSEPKKTLSEGEVGTEDEETARLVMPTADTGE